MYLARSIVEGGEWETEKGGIGSSYILQLVKTRGGRRADEDNGRECNPPLWSGPAPGGRVGCCFRKSDRKKSGCNHEGDNSTGQYYRSITPMDGGGWISGDEDEALIFLMRWHSDGISAAEMISSLRTGGMLLQQDIARYHSLAFQRRGSLWIVVCACACVNLFALPCCNP